MTQLNKNLFISEDILKHMCIEKSDIDKMEPLKVMFGDLEVVTGSVVTPTQARIQPHLDWEDANPEWYYYLVMIGLDAPKFDSHRDREWMHWCVGNIPGKHIKSGEVLAEYIGVWPPENELHRYVLLVYKQLGSLSFNIPHLKNNSAEGRQNHNAHAFASKQKMEGPIAGNFFMADWDEHVPDLLQQMNKTDEQQAHS